MNSICKYLVLFRQPPETQIYFLIMKIEKGKTKQNTENISSWKSQNKRDVHFFSLLLLCCCQTGKRNHVEKIKKNMRGICFDKEIGRYRSHTILYILYIV